jgi:hypothetical protein
MFLYVKRKKGKGTRIEDVGESNKNNQKSFIIKLAKKEQQE